MNEPHEGGQDELKALLLAWRIEGIITADQAEAIAKFQGAPLPDTELSAESQFGEARQPAPTQRVPPIVEVLGYLGGILAIAAVIALLAQSWDELETWAKVAAPAGMSVAFTIGALAFDRNRHAPLVGRLTSFLWLVTSLGVAGTLGVLGAEAFSWSGEASGLMTGLGAGTWSFLLWRRHQWIPQHAVFFVCALATAVSALSFSSNIAPELIALTIWGIGISWILLTRAGLLPPAETGFALGAIAAVIGALSTNSGGNLGVEWGPGFAVVTGAALVAVSVVVGSLMLLVIGAFGLVVSLIASLATYLPDSVGAPLILLLAAVVLLGSAVMVYKLGGRIRLGRKKGAREAATQLDKSGKGPRQPRPAVAIAGAIATVLAVSAVVAYFGFRGAPTYKSLIAAHDKNIRGAVAFARSDFTGDSPMTCIYVIPAGGGEEKKLDCTTSYFNAVTWTPDGQIALQEDVYIGEGEGSYYGPGKVVTYDPTTGKVSQGATIPDVDLSDSGKNPPDAMNVPGRGEDAFLETSYGGGVAKIRELDSKGQRGRTVFSVDGAPLSYRFETATFSPDGKWVLACDSEGQLLVIDAIGNKGARLLADGVDPWVALATWHIEASPASKF